jgi:hypothetical protein
MTLKIDDTTMTSDQTAHTARHAPDRNGWEVSWLPGQTLDRNTAITAMILADTTAERANNLTEGHELWPHMQSWAGELGLTAPDAMRSPESPSRPSTPTASRSKPVRSQTEKQPTSRTQQRTNAEFRLWKHRMIHV